MLRLAITILLANVVLATLGSKNIELKEIIQANGELRSVSFQIFTRDDEGLLPFDVIVWTGHSRELPSEALKPEVKKGVKRPLQKAAKPGQPPYLP